MKLFAFERAWAAAAFDAVLPEPRSDVCSSAPRLPHGLTRLDPARRFDDMLAASPIEQAVGLRLTLWLVALAPLWILLRPRTIVRIGAAERQLVLERLLASRTYAVRQLALAFKALAAMLYVRSPAIRAVMTGATASRESVHAPAAE